MDSIVDPYSKGDRRPDVSKNEVSSFEKKYKNDRASSLKQIKKGIDLLPSLLLFGSWLIVVLRWGFEQKGSKEEKEESSSAWFCIG